MRNRLPSWALLLYLVVDLANPFVPGAVSFTPEGGLVWVEGMPHAGGLRDGNCPALIGCPSPDDVIAPEVAVRAPDRRASLLPRLAQWLADVRTGDPPARDFPPPVSDDH